MTTPPHPDTPSWNDRDPSSGDRVPDASQDFWGDAGDWPSEPRDHREPRQRLGAAVSRWWNSTGSLPVTRVHGTPTRHHPVVADDTDRLPTDDWSSNDAPDTRRTAPTRIVGASTGASRVHDWSAADWSDDDAIMDDWTVDEWSTDDGSLNDRHDDDPVPPGPRRHGVDPLLARLGGLAIVLTLLVPLVLGFTSGDDDDADALRTSTPAVSPSQATPPTIAPLTTAAATAADTSAAAPTAATAPPATAASPAASTSSLATEPDETTSTEPTGTEPIADMQALEIDTCALEYEVAAGDFWIRIADGSGVPLADVLAANAATVSTPLYPGRTVCLPEGATTPPPPPPPTTAAPTTVAPPTTSRPSTTSSRPATTVPSTSRPPATPTTTAPAPRPPTSNASPAEVQAIIRAIWPDDLEERALQVAWRESNYIPTAKNFCCYGVFQIYWSVHKGWLAGIGITTAEQLYDPTLNTRAALALYERSGGWGPWGG